MKIGIITHHDVHNHGAVLQLYGLKRVLESLGYEAKALTYKKNYDFLEDYAENKYSFSIKSIPYYLRYLMKNGFSRTIFNYKKKVILDEFKNTNNVIGEFYSRAKKLDGVFIGSDEVFSIETGLNSVFWGMGVPCENIYSYGGCFGPTTIDFIKEKMAVEYISAGIQRLKKILVRDNNSKTIIEQLSDRSATLVCDPVILYGYKEEKKKFKRPLEKKYILVYAYDNNMNDIKEVEEIKKFAKENNLVILSVGFYHKWCDKNINVSPVELLNYIRYAEFVVTDTFHGSVTSLVMETQFTVKIRTNTNKVGFLMEEYNLRDRIIKDFNELQNMYNNKINYNEVNKSIEENRKISLNYINECIKGIR